MSLPPSNGQGRSKKGAKKRSNHASDRMRPCPISKLHDDILWLIFTLNTADDADFIDNIQCSIPQSSLITAQYTSQVCTRWRDVILASSSIWANSLDLKFLDQTGDHWRDEILKRAGNSLLSVQGVIYAGSPNTDFFLSLLEIHWLRLRRISIRVKDEGISDDQRWLALRRPVPNLEIISVFFPSCPAFSTTDKILFSNDAPSIHTISLHRTAFKLSGPWLSQVRHLQLSDYFLGQMILHALAEMLSLETLHIRCMDSSIKGIGAGNGHFPTITLPRLTSLNLDVRYEILINLLGHIAPTSGCSEELITNLEDLTVPNLSAEDTSLLRRGFAAHFQCFSDFKHNETISWKMTADVFTLDNLLNDQSNWPQPSRFRLTFDIDTGPPCHGIPYIILNALHSCDLRSIKTLQLDISRAVLVPTNSDLIQFYQAVTSVETMHLDSQTIESLLNIQEHADGPILVPGLQNIVFDTNRTLKSDVIMQFLSRRRNAGVPVKMFDLSRCKSTGQEQLLFLEGMDGMEVIWDEKIRLDM